VRAGEVRTVCADTLPVGTVENVEASSVRMTLSQGDLLVMMTDGVLLSFPGGEEEISAAIAGLAWLHPQAVGERLITQALDGGEATDDMAVLCVKVGRTPA
jgi:stage II sporulation protein E